MRNERSSIALSKRNGKKTAKLIVSKADENETWIKKRYTKDKGSNVEGFVKGFLW